jgi:hypothetical protein
LALVAQPGQPAMVLLGDFPSSAPLLLLVEVLDRMAPLVMEHRSQQEVERRSARHLRFALYKVLVPARVLLIILQAVAAVLVVSATMAAAPQETTFLA